jgi:uncharacterized membrane protein
MIYYFIMTILCLIVVVFVLWIVHKDFTMQDKHDAVARIEKAITVLYTLIIAVMGTAILIAIIF